MSTVDVFIFVRDWLTALYDCRSNELVVVLRVNVWHQDLNTFIEEVLFPEVTENPTCRQVDVRNLPHPVIFAAHVNEWGSILEAGNASINIIVARPRFIHIKARLYLN